MERHAVRVAAMTPEEALVEMGKPWMVKIYRDIYFKLTALEKIHFDNAVWQLCSDTLYLRNAIVRLTTMRGKVREYAREGVCPEVVGKAPVSRSIDIPSIQKFNQDNNHEVLSFLQQLRQFRRTEENRYNRETETFLALYNHHANTATVSTFHFPSPEPSSKVCAAQ